MSTQAKAPGKPEVKPYRLGVGMLLLNPAGRVFVGSRIDMPGDAWQMPQGGIEPGETPEEAALRELQEEVGTNAAEIIATSRDWYFYDLPKTLLQKIWGGRYRGQQQKWFVLRFLGEDCDICIDGEQPEFRDWRWAAFETLPDLAIPFKRRLYEGLVTEFTPVMRDFSEKT